jgi:hypothetical protein
VPPRRMYGEVIQSGRVVREEAPTR